MVCLPVLIEWITLGDGFDFFFAVILGGFWSDYADDSPPPPKEAKRTSKGHKRVKADGKFNEWVNNKNTRL